MENDEKYRKRKEAKKEIYKQYGFDLIEVHDKDIKRVDKDVDNIHETQEKVLEVVQRIDKNQGIIMHELRIKPATIEDVP